MKTRFINAQRKCIRLHMKRQKASAGCWISTGSVYTAVMMYGDCIRTYGCCGSVGGPAWLPRLNSVHRLPIIRLRIFLKCVWRIWQGHTCRVLHGDHEDGVYVFGNTDMHIRRIAIGTGAATDLYELLPLHPDAVIVSDDGITSYDAAQYALDHGIGMVVVNHAAVERAGLKAMVPWLQERMKDAEAVWLHDGFSYSLLYE